MDVSGRSRLICQPSSRTEENSPYGMSGGIVETAASLEARLAPRSYPTGPRLDPTRLRGGGGNILTYSASNWIGVDPPS